MPSWSLPLDDITEFGRPYPLDTVSSETPSAFVVRLEAWVCGAKADPRGGYLVAFGAACTHMGCTLVKGDDGVIDYRPASGDRVEGLVCGPCPCHGTTFDLAREGLVVLGPATQNLPQLEIGVDEQAVRSSGWRGPRDPRRDAWPLDRGAGG